MIEERRQNILKELAEKGKVRVCELSKKYRCSEVTIRNDIKNMDEEGLLIRTHGGALPIDEKDNRKYTAESIYRYTNRKKSIAACAYSYIKDRDTIIIDDASSSFYLAEYIKDHPEKRIAVVTNSLLVGNELAGAPHVELYMVCGYVGGHLAATMGEAAVKNISQFHVDKAFIGVHGINFEVGLTSIATPQMEVKQAILKSSDDTYVLADSSKFSGGYLSVVCPISAVGTIITDGEVSNEVIKMAQRARITLVIAE
ncbi:MAG: DeoR/GlpR family DNA-binding transcription regulator [Hespellia sp.]|nr:DeoR/GlpR family DNA-binding transcription regulator [Hespellia sp.]